MKYYDKNTDFISRIPILIPFFTQTVLEKLWLSVLAVLPYTSKSIKLMQTVIFQSQSYKHAASQNKTEHALTRRKKNLCIHAANCTWNLKSIILRFFFLKFLQHNSFSLWLAIYLCFFWFASPFIWKKKHLLRLISSLVHINKKNERDNKNGRFLWFYHKCYISW